jgi:hypothetical protein
VRHEVISVSSFPPQVDGLESSARFLQSKRIDLVVAELGVAAAPIPTAVSVSLTSWW